MLPTVAVVYLLAGCGWAHRPAPAETNINEFVDDQMKSHNAMLTSRGISTFNIPAKTTGGINFSKGKQHGANTLRRTGDGVSIRLNSNSVTYRYRLGFELLSFSFDKITFDGGHELETPKVEVNGGNAMNFDFTIIKNEESCKVTLDRYQFESMGGLELKSDKKTEEDEERLKASFMKHINSVLIDKKSGVERHLQSLCDPANQMVSQI